MRHSRVGFRAFNSAQNWQYDALRVRESERLPEEKFRRGFINTEISKNVVFFAFPRHKYVVSGLNSLEKQDGCQLRSQQYVQTIFHHISSPVVKNFKKEPSPPSRANRSFFAQK